MIATDDVPNYGFTCEYRGRFPTAAWSFSTFHAAPLSTANRSSLSIANACLWELFCQRPLE